MSETIKFPFNFSIKTYDSGVGSELKYQSILKYQQQSGEEQLLTLGCGYDWLYEKGIAFVVTNMTVNIHRLPKNNDKVTIETWSRGNQRSRFYRSYNWIDENGEIMIESAAVFVMFDIKSRKIVRPEAVEFNVPFDFDLDNSAKNPQKIKFPNDLTLNDAGTKTVFYSLIDSNTHLNNSYYVDFITDFVPNMQNKRIKSFRIDFIGEAIYQDVINVKTAFIDNEGYFSGDHERGACFRAWCEFES